MIRKDRRAKLWRRMAGTRASGDTLWRCEQMKKDSAFNPG